MDLVGAEQQIGEAFVSTQDFYYDKQSRSLITWG